MDNKNDNERSTASKVIFGTWLTNGLVIAVGGFVLFLVGLIASISAASQLIRFSGETDYAMLMTIGGIVLLLVGVCCIGVHLSKKKK